MRTSSPVHLLAARCGGAWTARPLAASGFCATWLAEGPGGRLFVKSLPLSRADVLAAEADGLDALARTVTIAVPRVEGCWIDEERDVAVLAMQWLDLGSSNAAASGRRLGAALAVLHRSTPQEGGGRFGWRRDNMLGGTPQRNRWSAQGGTEGWTTFYGSERLGAMRDRLAAASAPTSLLRAVDGVIEKLPAMFADGYGPRPGLVHSDLWSGNRGALADGTPVVFDPAVSVSDPESELAMMELFGAPPAGFWPAYREIAPVAPGYAWRRGLYQLHHLLNHELLFGGYARRAMEIISALP